MAWKIQKMLLRWNSHQNPLVHRGHKHGGRLLYLTGKPCKRVPKYAIICQKKIITHISALTPKICICMQNMTLPGSSSRPEICRNLKSAFCVEKKGGKFEENMHWIFLFFLLLDYTLSQQERKKRLIKGE